MTEYGKKKNQSNQNIEWVTASAENLPFENESFDAYLVSFGVRNFDNIKKSLDEAHRVLKSGGRFICLEFSKVQNEDLSKLYRAYSKIFPIFLLLCCSTLISYSRVVWAKCHTIQQVIVGSFIGIPLGILGYMIIASKSEP